MCLAIACVFSPWVSCGFGGRAQQWWREAVLEATVTPPRRQEGEESVCWVTRVFDGFTCPFQILLPTYVPFGRKWCSVICWAIFNLPLLRLPVWGRAATVPSCDTVGQDALDDAAIEIHQDVWGDVVLPQSPLEEEALVSLLYQLGASSCPGEILGDVDSQELKAVHMFHRCPFNVDGVCGSTISSLVFSVLSSWLLVSPCGTPVFMVMVDKL